MGFIHCHTCKENRGVVAGSANEEQYMRLIDASNSNDGKLYFCSEKCYIEREFMLSVFHRAKEPVVGISVYRAKHNPELLPFIEELLPFYDEITSGAFFSYGLNQFRKRNGLRVYSSKKGESEASDQNEEDEEDSHGFIKIPCTPGEWY
jgi:hypothetical protein